MSQHALCVISCVALMFLILMCTFRRMGRQESFPEDKTVNYFKWINTLIDLSEDKQWLPSYGAMNIN